MMPEGISAMEEHVTKASGVKKRATRIQQSSSYPVSVVPGDRCPANSINGMIYLPLDH